MTEPGDKPSGAAKEQSDTAEHPTLIELLRASGRGLNYEDVPWFVKDFHVLYHAASDAVAAEPKDRQRALRALSRQLDRLAPAFRECETVRTHVVNQVQVRRKP